MRQRPKERQTEREIERVVGVYPQVIMSIGFEIQLFFISSQRKKRFNRFRIFKLIQKIIQVKAHQRWVC